MERGACTCCSAPRQGGVPVPITPFDHSPYASIQELADCPACDLSAAIQDNYRLRTGHPLLCPRLSSPVPQALAAQFTRSSRPGRAAGNHAALSQGWQLWMKTSCNCATRFVSHHTQSKVSTALLLETCVGTIASTAISQRSTRYDPEVRRMPSLLAFCTLTSGSMGAVFGLTS